MVNRKKKSTAQTKTLPGSEYQAQISLLYILYLHQVTKKCYEVTPESENAGELNDFNANFWDNNGKKQCCFLQIKKVNGEIGYTKLVCDAEYDPFSLVKYFKSFQIIDNCKDQTTTQAVSMYVSTNGTIQNDKKSETVTLKLNSKRRDSKINYNGREELELEKVDDDEQRSYNFFKYMNANLYRISNKNMGQTELYNRLQNSNVFSQLMEQLLKYSLAGYFPPDKIVGRNFFDMRKNIFAAYHGTLVKYNIINASLKHFHTDFINGYWNDIPEHETLMEFRHQFFEKYKEKRKNSKLHAKELSDEDVKDELSNREVHLGKKFGQGVHLFNGTLYNPEALGKKIYEIIDETLENIANGNPVIVDRKQFKARDKINRRNNIDRMAGYVFEGTDLIDLAKFKEEFIDNDQVRPDLKEFKHSLENCFKRKYRNFNIQMLQPCRFLIKDYLSIKEVEKFPSNTLVSDEEIRKYFDNFFIAVNQPDNVEDKIKELLKMTISADRVDDVANDLLRRTSNWIKDCNSEPWDRNEIDKLIGPKNATPCKTTKKDVVTIINSYLGKINDLKDDDIIEEKDFNNFVSKLRNLTRL